MKKAFLVGIVAVALAGCASYYNDDEYNTLAAQAENEIKLADKTGFEWRDTDKFMQESKDAKAAADRARQAGDRATAKKEFEKAMQLARTALAQAQLAQQQAKDQANPVIHY
jgi:hypothetical protein